MNAIKKILKEEAERLEQLCKKYRQEINKLPRGSISLKERKGNLYAYLAYRKKGKVCFDYLGKADSIKVKEFQKKIESRKKYQRLLQQAQNNLKNLGKLK